MRNRINRRCETESVFSQCGFRDNRSTTDCILMLHVHTIMQNDLLQKQKFNEALVN